ncbi:MAG: chitobiase/beta-hexosaminidase C-terminal domain-containing protein, partial [Bythopirellula sp.]
PNSVILPGGLLGNDLTDPEDDGSLSGTITVGNPSSPGGEEPPKALDNSVTSKWLSFSPTGTYYQFRFNSGSEAVTAYTITSANDAADRDPYSWTLSGSNDGTNFTVVDSRNAQDFAGRFETQLFEFLNSTLYEYYRFDFQTEFGVTGNNQPVAIQLAEIELFSALISDEMILPGGPIGNDLTDPENDGVLAGQFSVGNANSPVGEEPFRALDNTASTKWLSFAPAGTFYQFRFDAGPQLVNAYTITSANDAAERDPYSWTLSGSNDGTNFTVIDTRDAQEFAERFETQWFQFENSDAYEFYRFDFQTEFGATGSNQPNSIQLAELELLAEGPVDFGPLIDIDSADDWDSHQTSLFERIEFDVPNPAMLGTLALDLQYDDGFVAYLNGLRVAESSAPVAVDFNSNATNRQANGDAVTVERFDLTPYLDQLVAENNVLALHGLNVDDDSADLLLRAELVATELLDVEYVPGFYEVATPGMVNGSGLVGFVADIEFSVERGFYDAPFQLQITSATPTADIYYTTNGEAPTAASGTMYTSPITISATTTLRAVGVQADHLDSNIGTQTYLFVNDIVSQDYQATLDAGFPTTWGGTAADYGIDSDVIGNFDTNGNPTGGDLFGGIYADQIMDSLRAIPTLSIVMNNDDMFGPNGIYTTPTASGVAWERATSVELIQPDGSPGFQVDAGIRIQGGAFRRHDLSRKHSLRLLFKSEYGPTKLNFPLFGEGAVDEFDTVTLRMDSNDGWAWSSAGNQPQYARDEFGRRTQLALGQVGSHGTRMHVYINGIYWGLYNPVERPDASFSANYYAGKKSQWDAINAGSVVDGDLNTWSTLGNLAQAVANASSETSRTAAYMFLQGKDPDGTNNPAVENYLDVDNYIDYMLVNLYGGNVDWPHRNWFASRQRGPESTGFKFHIWDMESALNLL